MANFNSPPDTPDPIKMMLLGDTGSGKTGALAPLIAGGYHVRMLDFERGAKILESYICDSKSPYTKAHPAGLWTTEQGATAAQRFEFETFMDPKRAFAGQITTASATSWQKAVKLLENWKTPTVDFGPVVKWGPECVLVIDTLSFASKNILNFNMAMNQSLGQIPSFNRDYRATHFHIENLLALLNDPQLRCHVIVNCHIAWHTETKVTYNSKGEPNLTANNPLSENRKGYPQTVGQAQWLILGRYFNNVVQVKSIGYDKRIITTVCDSNMELIKTSAPLRVKRQYPIETGLLELFRDLQGAGASAPSTAAPTLAEAAQ